MDRAASSAGQRFGLIGIVGKPNAGKSTLLNALVGESIAIVSDKPQATRVPVIGLRTDAETQILFVDQPGILDPEYLMHEAMRTASLESMSGVDAILYLVPQQDAWVSLETVDPELESLGKPVANVVSKCDAGGLLEDTIPAPCFPVSAEERLGLDAVIDWCTHHLSEGPFRYDVDEVSTQPTRFFVSEFVREAAFNLLSDELPYAIAAEVDEFHEGTDPLYIRVTLYVERASQKGIVVGRGGATVRAIGTRARQRIEALLGRRVYLDLWVKTLPKWRRKPAALARFGLPLITGEQT